MDGFQDCKERLLELGKTSEKDIWWIYMIAGEQEPDYETLVHSDNGSLAQKMVFRFRNSGDIVFFWNSLPEGCRSRLLSSYGIRREVDLDFFVWLGNNRIEWEDRKPRNRPIALFFEVSDEQRKTWIEEYQKKNELP